MSGLKVLAISSHVAMGRVGLRAIAPVFDAMGITAHLLPTIILPWHPGHGTSTRVELPEFDTMLDELRLKHEMAEGAKLNAVLTGYFANAEQVTATAKMIRQMKLNDPELVYLCDPVLGDNGKLYVPIEVANAIRDKLLPLADFLTPNAFELGWLSDLSITSFEEAMVASHAIAPAGATVLASSIPDEDAQLLSMVLTSIPTGSKDRVEVSAMKHERFSYAPHGTGDLMAALFLALELIKLDHEAILSSTTFVMYELVAMADQMGVAELPLEAVLFDLLDELLQGDENEIMEDDSDAFDQFETPDPNKLH